MNQNLPWEELTKYFAGELTKEEARKVETWIKADPDREEQMRQLDKIWRESGIPLHKRDVDEAWSRLSLNMDKLEREKVPGDSRIHNDRPFHGDSPVRTAQQDNLNHRRSSKPGSTIRRVALAAATVLLVSTAAYFSWSYNTGITESLAAEEAGNQVFETQDGERATYVLSDGSTVVLHAGSRMEVPNQFNVDNRELSLQGEAYFDVKHDAQNPFVVHSEHSYTRVLGTSFLVQAWPGPDREVEVIVVEGKVALGGNHPQTDTKEAIITQNQIGVLVGDESPVVNSVDDLGWHLGWTEGRLSFDDRPLSEIIPRLERWYAVDIETEQEEIGAKRITAEIDYSQPMNEVLQGIALSLELEFETEDRVITFRAKDQDNNRE